MLQHFPLRFDSYSVGCPSPEGLSLRLAAATEMKTLDVTRQHLLTRSKYYASTRPVSGS